MKNFLKKNDRDGLITLSTRNLFSTLLLLLVPFYIIPEYYFELNAINLIAEITILLTIYILLSIKSGSLGDNAKELFEAFRFVGGSMIVYFNILPALTHPEYLYYNGYIGVVVGILLLFINYYLLSFLILKVEELDELESISNK